MKKLCKFCMLCVMVFFPIFAIAADDRPRFTWTGEFTSIYSHPVLRCQCEVEWPKYAEPVFDFPDDPDFEIAQKRVAELHNQLNEVVDPRREQGDYGSDSISIMKVKDRNGDGVVDWIHFYNGIAGFTLMGVEFPESHILITVGSETFDMLLGDVRSGK